MSLGREVRIGNFVESKVFSVHVDRKSAKSPP